jgi:hypothetical protein
MEPLTLEEQKELTAEAIKEHRDQVAHLKKSKEEIMKALDEYDPYEHGGMHLLDTDYDNYMISYHCRETVNE